MTKICCSRAQLIQHTQEKFKSSRGAFRKRIGIQSVVRHGEAASDSEATSEFVKFFGELIKVKRYTLQQVLNCDRVLPEDAQATTEEEEKNIPGHKPRKIGRPSHCVTTARHIILCIIRPRSVISLNPHFWRGRGRGYELIAFQFISCLRCQLCSLICVSFVLPSDEDRWILRVRHRLAVQFCPMTTFDTSFYGSDTLGC